MKKLALFAVSSILFGASSMSANDWYVGIGGGLHSNKMDYSNLNEEIYPESKSLNRGVFSIFGQYEFGNQNQFGIRPEISFLRRGGKLTEINNKTYESLGLNDINYTLNSGYCDVRLSFIYNFLNTDSRFRPYVFVTPILGFSTGGSIKYQEEYADGAYFGYGIDVNEANIASTYFAGAVGLGVKYQFNIGKDLFFLGVEANYEYGFTDTYGGKEKDGEAYINSDYFPAYKRINGDRKFSGFEVKATLGIPLSVFKKAEKPAPILVEEPQKPMRTAPKPAPVVEQKDNRCYSLEEIIDMMARGERIEGKTICAINDITFAFGKSSINKKSHDYLDKLATTLIRTNAKIEVKGHTDNIGTEEFNMNLSKERAINVVNYLINKGVPKDKLSYSYYGMSKPLTDDNSEAGRALNRRVEFEILY